MLVELGLVEQRYKAVLEVLNDGASVTDVARRYGVARQTVHSWLRKYATDGLAGLVDETSRPRTCPHLMSPETEALVIDWRRAHPGWGPRTIVSRLARQGVEPLPGRSSVYRALIRHQLIDPKKRRRRRQDYIPLSGRILAAADVYHAMLEDRPHRGPLTRSDAAAELRRAARDGELDGLAVDAVLAAANHPVRRTPSAPAGLTPREVEVLVLVARGATTRAVAVKLGITPKTAGNHIERIYAKIAVSTRAEAAMFAMRHGLAPAWDTTES